ncbi:Serine/threonine-protein kinase [Blastocladiella emersonii ATCC 22665]|nr:Serine/threonine-protein kinase [Blastocladiella emersonii ATCC 22665]
MTAHHSQLLTPFSATQPNPQLLAAKGQLCLRVVEAHDLMVRNPATARPYCVVEFERNEFVTKEAPVRTSPDAPGRSHTVWNHLAVFDIARPDGEFIITVWDRAATSDGEAFLGMMRARPSQVHDKVNDHIFQLGPRYPQERISGVIRVQFMYKLVKGKPLSANDFDLLKVLGKGSFGKVLQVRKKDTGRVYAMKILNKKDIIARQEVAHTLSERNVLVQASSPFLVGLKFSFQTPDKLYLVLDYMNGGEVFYHLQKEQVFSETRAKFYTAELVLALDHLHRHGIVYRDLKPENVLLDSTGHVALTDFGLCKENLYDATTTTFCGTAEYLAPEVLSGAGYGRAVDWWSLGILLYEMTAGIPPFYSENTNLMYQKIMYEEIAFPPGFSAEAQSLIRGLLTRDARVRLGSSNADAEEIKRHPFFADIDWDKLRKKQIVPPFKPTVESETDTSNFDPTFTESMPEDSLPNNSTPLSETLQDHFKGFTYNGESNLHVGSVSSASSFTPRFGSLMEE